MTHKAYTRDNPMADGIDLALVDRHPSHDTLTRWATERVVLTGEDRHAHRADDPDMWLTLSDDAARALYEALAEHYGHAPGDNRLLRQDYLAERARVDHLTEAIIVAAVGTQVTT